MTKTTEQDPSKVIDKFFDEQGNFKEPAKLEPRGKYVYKVVGSKEEKCFEGLTKAQSEIKAAELGVSGKFIPYEHCK